MNIMCNLQHIIIINTTTTTTTTTTQYNHSFYSTSTWYFSCSVTKISMLIMVSKQSIFTMLEIEMCIFMSYTLLLSVLNIEKR
jgi:hypothetical protein